MARILVVDDEAMVLEVLSRMLSAWGHDVVTAEDVQDGIDKYDPASFDLVLTDYQTPRGTGLQLLEKVREADPETPVFVISGHWNQGDRSRAHELGASTMDKPCDFNRLRLDIQKALEAQDD